MTDQREEPWIDRGCLRDGIIFCMDPGCESCDRSIQLRYDNCPPSQEDVERLTARLRNG